MISINKLNKYHLTLKKMSKCLLIGSISGENREKIANDLTLQIQTGYVVKTYKQYEVFDADLNFVRIPLYYALSSGFEINSNHKQISIHFNSSLRDDQVKVKTETIKMLNDTNTSIISCYPGFGKTRVAIYIASKIKLKTLIIVNLLVLVPQWISSIKEVCPTTIVSVIEPSKKTNNFDADIFIANAINVPKFGDVFSDVGFVIVDEVHLIMSEVLSKSLYHVHPRFLLGLSATPYRNDEYDKMINLFFGTDRVVRKMSRYHIINKITTGYTPEIEYDSRGKMIWNSVIDFQSNHLERNMMIVGIIKKHTDRNFLVLTKRVEQAKFIHSKLVEQGENAVLYVSDTIEFDRSARILIGTIKKLGVGFDHVKLDTLIAGCDLESYFIQYLGRIFRSPEGIEPVVFDIVDNNKTLVKHYKTREKVYVESGGKIVKYKY